MGLIYMFLQAAEVGHRTYEYQLGLDPNGVKDLVADPDASEHRTGLAVDFISAPEWGTFINANRNAWKWLCNNAMNYGFILRYPLGCKDKTGISAESWHWRYIGKEHAKKFYDVAKKRNLGTTSAEQESKGIMEGAYTGDTTTYYLYTFEEYYEEFVK